MNYPEVINCIEDYCKSANLDHRFVGGTVSDFIGPQTDYQIDAKQRKVVLINPNQPSMIRPDQTVKDIDIVVLTPDRQKFVEATQELGGLQASKSKTGAAFPFISIEAARHADWPPRNSWKQFVSAFEYNSAGQPHLVFGVTGRRINPDSLQPWNVDIGNGMEITSFHPLGHMLCYALRVPSGVKRKDKSVLGEKEFGAFNKMGLLGRLAVRTREEEAQAGLNYSQSFREWADYIRTLSRNPDMLTKVKSVVTRLYWDTIGTTVAHGSGIFAKLSKSSNKLTG